LDRTEPKRNALRVLITSAGAPSSLGVLRCLAVRPDVVVLGCDADPEALAGDVYPQFQVVPDAADSGFLPRLLATVDVFRPDALLPLSSPDMLVIAGAVDEFQRRGCQVVCSPHSTLTLCTSKSLVYGAAVDAGVPVPKHTVATNVDAFTSAVESLWDRGHDACFKPDASSGGRGFRIIDNDVDEFSQLLRGKGRPDRITLREAQRILSSHRPFSILVSEYLPGDEYSVDCLVVNGEAVVIAPRLRRRIERGVSVYSVLIPDEEAISLARRLCGCMEFRGPIGIQTRRSASGQLRLLEVNARIQGSSPGLLEAGANLPLTAVLAQCKALEPMEVALRWHTTFRRHSAELVIPPR